MSKIQDILIIHNFYKLLNVGGEDRTVILQKELFEKKGHKVHLYAEYNDDINCLVKKITTFFMAYFNIKAFLQIFKTIKKNNIKVVIIHNMFPILSPGVILASKLAGAKVFVYLHNFRWLCCGDYLFRGTSICSKCPDKKSHLDAIKIGCYRNKILSLWRCSQIIFWRGIIEKFTDYFICPSKIVKSIYENYGFKAEKLLVLNHFVESSASNGNNIKQLNSSAPEFLFIGRLDNAKGIIPVINSFKENGYKLKIIGHGPLMEEVEELSSGYNNIEILGRVEPREVYNYLKESDFLIQSSIWYETFGLTIAEAFSVGTPVIATNLGTRKEFVENNHTGVLYEIDVQNDLNESIEKALSLDYEQLSNNCKEKFNELFLDEIWYEKIINVFETK